MGESIEQQVIDFLTTYCSAPPGSIKSSTTFESLGLNGSDKVTAIMELEDHFGLTYQNGDDAGIITVGDAVALITRKLSSDS
jgi:acyl carrier protein